MRLWLLTLLVCAGCGRIGYRELPPKRSFPPADPDSGTASHPSDGSDGTPSLDGGSDLADAAPVDAGQPGNGEASGADGGATLPRDDTGQIDCSALGDALACSSFDEGVPANLTTRTYSGTIGAVGGAIEAQTTAAQGKAAVIATFPALYSGQLYVRFDLSVSASDPLSGVNFLGVTDATEPWPAQEIDFNVVPGPHMQTYLLESGRSITSNAPFALEQWTCVEILIAISNTDGSVQLSQDGQVVLSATGLDTSLPAGIARLSLGVDFAASGQAAATVRFDNLIAATQAFQGCP